MDCHIKVAEGWLEEPYKLMKEDYRTMVNPTVFQLDPVTYNFYPSTKGIGSSAGFYWSFVHKWGSGRPGTMESTITMGQFFVTKRWWTEIEGMDPGMEQWGAENIDVSLRTWLCGGRILCAKTCYVAHTFRSKLPYHVDNSKVLRNAVRSAEVWLGEEYIDNFYKARGMKRGTVDYGDISSIDFYF